MSRVILGVMGVLGTISNQKQKIGWIKSRNMSILFIWRRCFSTYAFCHMLSPRYFFRLAVPPAGALLKVLAQVGFATLTVFKCLFAFAYPFDKI